MRMNKRFESNKLWLGALIVLALTAAAHLRGVDGAAYLVARPRRNVKLVPKTPQAETVF